MLDEHESDALERWLTARGDDVRVSSDLVRVEVMRGAHRADTEQLPDARALLAILDLLPLTGALLDDAGSLAGPHLRSLDAIHLASALTIRDDLSAFVAYDQRLAAAAREAGLTVVQPGAQASH